jgi:metal-sulfur cluster biosynthetic enzyme
MSAEPTSTRTADLDEPAVWRALQAVQDPEFPVSIVDLGLVYGVEVRGGRVEVAMTLTSMGCPCAHWIVEDVKETLGRLPGAGDVEVEVVWDPPWTRERITPAGRAALKGSGVSA